MKSRLTQEYKIHYRSSIFVILGSSCLETKNLITKCLPSGSESTGSYYNWGPLNHASCGPQLAPSNNTIIRSWLIPGTMHLLYPLSSNSYEIVRVYSWMHRNKFLTEFELPSTSLVECNSYSDSLSCRCSVVAMSTSTCWSTMSNLDTALCCPWPTFLCGASTVIVT